MEVEKREEPVKTVSDARAPDWKYDSWAFGLGEL